LASFVRQAFHAISIVLIFSNEVEPLIESAAFSNSSIQHYLDVPIYYNGGSRESTGGKCSLPFTEKNFTIFN